MGDAAPAAATDPLQQLRRSLGDRYTFERLLGQGGMGAVYLARDKQLDRPVALKVLPAEFAVQPDLRERFLRETRLSAGFSHPNIVPVFAVEEREDLLAFAMGFVEGESLADRVARDGPLPVRDAVRLLQDVAYALAYAHGRGVVHRDIKPDNIMIERATGRALVMDFGIARGIAAAPERPGLTRVGEVVGTPEYMSPEQASGDAVDGRSDLYALGRVAWFALAGRSAMRADSTQRTLVKQLTEVVPPVEAIRTDLPPALAAVVAQCVQKEPDARFATAEALVEALEAAQLSAPEVPQPIRLFEREAATAGLVAIFGTVVAVLMLALLTSPEEGNLDVALPVSLVVAVVLGRQLQLLGAGRALRARGFSVEAVQAGFDRMRAERDGERAALRAGPAAVAKRRREVALLIGLLIFTEIARQWVLRYHRVETKPDWYSVDNVGAIVLYSAYITRGFALVALARSPLRPSLGERCFRWTWGGVPGRLILGALGPRGSREQRGRTLPPTGALTVPPVRPVTASFEAPVRPVSPASADPEIAQLERRVRALEQWRDQAASS